MNHTFVIDSIFEGHMPSWYAGKKGQFLVSVGIDPDVPLSDNAADIKPAGAIRPVHYKKFSTLVDAAVIDIITQPKTATTYVILANGKIISYDSSLGSETLVGTVAGGEAHGSLYYNNYIYILGTGAAHDDASRLGPLNGAPVLVDNIWKGATLGAQTALVNTNYPTTLLTVGYLKHHGHVHGDNRAYFLDYKDGVGLVHFIKTTKAAVEGDTNDGSTYGFLDLPFGYLPMTLCSYGTDMAVAAGPTTSNVINQGSAQLFLFNPGDTTPSFYRRVPLPGQICSRLWYENGVLYGIVGDLNKGHCLFRYMGGDSVEPLAFCEDGHPPLQNAGDKYGSRLVWGTDISYPIKQTAIFAYGSKSGLFPQALHNIASSDLI